MGGTLLDFRAQTVRMLCRRSANLMRMATGSSHIVRIRFRSWSSSIRPSAMGCPWQQDDHDINSDRVHSIELVPPRGLTLINSNASCICRWQQYISLCCLLQEGSTHTFTCKWNAEAADANKQALEKLAAVACVLLSPKECNTTGQSCGRGTPHYHELAAAEAEYYKGGRVFGKPSIRDTSKISSLWPNGTAVTGEIIKFMSKVLSLHGEL